MLQAGIKGKQQVTEVLALDGRVLGIEVVDADEPSDDATHIFTEGLADFFE